MALVILKKDIKSQLKANIKYKIQTSVFAIRSFCRYTFFNVHFQYEEREQSVVYGQINYPRTKQTTNKGELFVLQQTRFVFQFVVQ